MLVEDYLARILADAHHLLRNAELVIANPPRGGLGPTVCEQLNGLGAPRLHLMSCSPASLVDDLRRLTGPAGRYRLIGARAFDTLPQTNHIEVVVWLVGRAESPRL
jgi:23S rRNA (uracil1939-C5)-methyltransferase